MNESDDYFVQCTAVPVSVKIGIRIHSMTNTGINAALEREKAQQPCYEQE